MERRIRYSRTRMKRRGREVGSGASVALIGEWNQGAHGGQNFGDHPVGGVEIISADEVPNLFKVNPRLRVEIISRHEPGRARRAAALFSRK